MVILIDIDWMPLLITFKLALVTTIVLFFIGLPLAYILAFSRSKFKPVIEAIIGMPLVLPPTVIGFYLLLLLSPTKGVGQWLFNTFNIQLVFSFSGLVIASVIYSLPFMIQPIQNGLENVPKKFQDVSYMLGKSKLETLWYVVLPNCKRALISGVVLTFAHTIGEFGVVLMIGGSIPNQTKVASISIYEEVEALNYNTAHLYALLLLVISFGILVTIYASKANHFKIGK